MNKPNILIGIPTVTPQEDFLKSVRPFIQKATEFCNITELWVHDKSLVDAQNEIAEVFLLGDFDCLLFLEDDISGHQIEMLDEMLWCGYEVVAIEYLSRHEPFYSTFVNKINGKWVQNQAKIGWHEFDQVSFGMTMLRRSLFDKLKRPFFRNSLNKKSRSTDSDFCERASKEGVKFLGICNYSLSHRGINRDNLKYKQMELLKQGGVKTRLGKWRNSI